MKVQSAFSIRTILIILLTSVIFTGCAVKIPVGELPENIQIRHLGSASSATPLIWHPDGQWFVANKGGLVVSSLVGDSTQVSRDEPAAMAWSPTGAFLAASFVSRDKTAVRIDQIQHNTSIYIGILSYPVSSPVSRGSPMQ